MKTFIMTLATVITIFTSLSSWASYVPVRGYIRTNGTVVSPHYRTSPNSYKWDNLNSSLSTENTKSYAYVNVRGYNRTDGTYVRPHIRSNPDGNPFNNLSSFLEKSPVRNSPYNPMNRNFSLKIG